MKKLIFIALFGLFAFISNAQQVTGTIAPGVTFLSDGTDYTLTNTTVAYTLYNAAQHYPATQDFLCNLDSLAGDHTNVAVAVYGRKFDTAAWAQIGSTINWTGSTSDTTIVFSNATANRYRSYKVEYTGTGTGTTTIDLQQFKLFLE